MESIRLKMKSFSKLCWHFETFSNEKLFLVSPFPIHRMIQVKIWVSFRDFSFIWNFHVNISKKSQQFQNRRTKWKKQENVVNLEEHKVNGSSKHNNVSSQDYRSDSTSPIGTGIGSKTGKSVAAELSAKITAKQNSRLKQQHHPNGGSGGHQKLSNKHMEPPRMKIHSQNPQKASLSPNLHHHHHHDLPLQYMDNKSSPIKSSFHSFHDVESRLASTKISLNDFQHAKPTAPPVALNLKRNYLWKKPKFQKSKEKKTKRQSSDEKWHDDENFWNKQKKMNWVDNEECVQNLELRNICCMLSKMSQ